MYSSAKFLSPRVTGGLPTPGPLVAAVALLAELAELLELLELFEELPHAARPAVTIALRMSPSDLLRNVLCMIPPGSNGCCNFRLCRRAPAPVRCRARCP